nr:DedA family protein [Aureimonas endophytica]
MGVPLPGETILVGAAIYAGTTHRLDIGTVILAAAAGAVVGDNLGYWIGRRIGFPLLVRHGGRIGLDEPRLKLGQYLFRRHGGKVVFFGRFVALLRTLAALLAGVNRMSWPHFMLCNLAGGVVWAVVFGLGGYSLGHLVERYAGPVGLALLAIGVVGAVIASLALRRAEARLLAEAERAFPGPLLPVPQPPR